MELIVSGLIEGVRTIKPNTTDSIRFYIIANGDFSPSGTVDLVLDSRRGTAILLLIIRYYLFLIVAFTSAKTGLQTCHVMRLDVFYQVLTY